ncbi:hypothetical protein HPB50_014368 [Hyalomma asiaticum]|uniref:Uncharacterized protein n=1 Tax=Hyalomma asiaticum TaxID=266040 RepID=A0ACB7TI83_HYAAI|nr:hypothetical protein HPB50_014368 [Hyalomma asiaticum]
MNSAVCSRCPEPHSTDTCQEEHPKWGDCDDCHDASSKDGPYMKKEKQVLRQVIRDGSTDREEAAKV